MTYDSAICTPFTCYGASIDLHVAADYRPTLTQGHFV